jgi:hypothetical protein
MTEEHPNPNPNTFANQISIFLRTNSKFNTSQKLTNAPLNGKKCQSSKSNTLRQMIPRLHK